MVAYQLDDDRVVWPEGVRKPEAVLIACSEGRDYVVFIELKGSAEEDKGKHGKLGDASAQLRSMIEHFHPYQRTGGARRHGDEHHDRWTNGEDRLEVMPGASHDVFGLVLITRSGGRRLSAPPERLGPKRVLFAHGHFHGALNNRLTITLDALLKHFPGTGQVER